MDKIYQAPELTDLGSVAALTAGQATGDFLDADFPDDTPGDQLTFSDGDGDFET